VLGTIDPKKRAGDAMAVSGLISTKAFREEARGSAPGAQPRTGAGPSVLPLPALCLFLGGLLGHFLLRCLLHSLSHFSLSLSLQFESFRTSE
jgi:hypothetical protein